MYPGFAPPCPNRHTLILVTRISGSCGRRAAGGSSLIFPLPSNTSRCYTRWSAKFAGCARLSSRPAIPLTPVPRVAIRPLRARPHPWHLQRGQHARGRRAGDIPQSPVSSCLVGLVACGAADGGSVRLMAAQRAFAAVAECPRRVERDRSAASGQAAPRGSELRLYRADQLHAGVPSVQADNDSGASGKDVPLVRSASRALCIPSVSIFCAQ